MLIEGESEDKSYESDRTSHDNDNEGSSQVCKNETASNITNGAADVHTEGERLREGALAKETKKGACLSFTCCSKNKIPLCVSVLPIHLLKVKCTA